MELAKSIKKAKRHREKHRVCKKHFMSVFVQRAPIIILLESLMHSHEHAYIQVKNTHPMSWETTMFVLPCRVFQLTYCRQNLNPTYGSLKKIGCFVNNNSLSMSFCSPLAFIILPQFQASQ